MKQLLSIEFSKLRKLVSLKVIFAVYIVMVPLWMYFLGAFFANINIPLLPTQQEFWSFPLVWKFTTYSASFFNVLMGVIIVIITCNEFSNRTLKQNVIDGMTKKQAIVSKFMIIVIISILVTLYTALVALIFGLINSVSMDLYKNIHFVFIYFLQTLCYFSFAYFFAVLIKKPALSIILFVVSFIVETIAGAFIPKIIYLFFPLNIFSKLTPLPFFEAIIKNAEQQSGEHIPIMDLTYIILLAVVYMLIFIAIAYQVLKKRDL